jgi:hypothetical protein
MRAAETAPVTPRPPASSTKTSSTKAKDESASVLRLRRWVGEWADLLVENDVAAGADEAVHKLLDVLGREVALHA